jgi:plasmid stabilization system protein ParE
VNKYKIYLSVLAEIKLQSILDYIEIEWSKKIRDDFLELFIDLTVQISSFPYSCPKYDEMSGIHKAVVNKNISFHYIIRNEEEIEIINVFDNRQNPDDLESIMSSFDQS